MNASAAPRQTPVIDAHNDSIVAYIRRGHLGLAGETGPQRRARSGG